MAHDGISIRAARPDELHLLGGIEIDAFEALRDAGAVNGEAHALPLSAMRRSLEEGLLLVATGAGDTPVAFASGAERDGGLYIVELDVARRMQRKGIGRGLMEAMIALARGRGLPVVTLTTDRQVPFNAPFYYSLGFREIEAGDDLPDLRLTLKVEIGQGADPHRRMAMVFRF